MSCTGAVPLSERTELSALVGVRVSVVEDHPAHALLIEARTADLSVGSRGKGGVRGLLLGSVSQAVLRHTTAAVTVVRTGTEHASD